MAMNIRDLEKDLIKKLAERVGEHEYDTRARGQSFYQQTPFGKVALHLAFIEHATDFDITADIAIRFDALEDIINEGSNLLTMSEKRRTFSIGAELGNISEWKQKRWTVRSPADIEEVSRSIMDAFVNIGLPYIEKYSNMETVLDALSGDDKTAWLHSPFHDVRAKQAICLAFLLGQRNRFSELVAAKTEFLTSVKDPGLQSFLELKDTLERQFTLRTQNR
jgi:hypothetical protein